MTGMTCKFCLKSFARKSTLKQHQAGACKKAYRKTEQQINRVLKPPLPIDAGEVRNTTSLKVYQPQTPMLVPQQFILEELGTPYSQPQRIAAITEIASSEMEEC